MLALVGASAQVLAQDTQLARADAWIAFEQKRDVTTARAQRIFYPSALALQAGILGFATAAHGVPTSARIALVAGAGLTAAAIIPTLASYSLDRQRLWFALGSAAAALGTGGGLIAADLAQRHDAHNASHGGGLWAGAAIGMQALLVLLPLALMDGFPDPSEYSSYARLPADQRPAEAARILRKLDRFEQFANGLSLLGAIAGSTVLAVGSARVADHGERRGMAALSGVMLGSSLLFSVPRLFGPSRLESFATGGPPARLGFNMW